MNNIIKTEADKLLYDYGILDMLEPYGQVHMVGSYRMDVMTWNDLDIYVENDKIQLKDIYVLMRKIFERFQPKWFEGKEVIEDNHHHYFIGFETDIMEELWNFDIWFFNKNLIKNTEEYCDNISKQIHENPILYDAVINIKQNLIKSGCYGTEFTSIDVYKAVTEDNVVNIEDFYAWKKNN